MQGCIPHEKTLIPIHYWKRMLCRVPALGKGHFALGKGFAKCYTRQRVHGKKFVGKDLFAECFLSDTRQRKVTVMAHITLTGALPSVFVIAECYTRQSDHNRPFFLNFYIPS
jgi:hypothetical protein